MRQGQPLGEIFSTLLESSSLHLPSCGFTEEMGEAAEIYQQLGGGPGGAEDESVDSSSPYASFSLLPHLSPCCLPRPCCPSLAPLLPLHHHHLCSGLWSSFSFRAPCSGPWVTQGLLLSRGPGWHGGRSHTFPSASPAASRKKAWERSRII